MPRALFSSIDRQWHEIPDAVASVSDPALVADIVETVPPVPDSTQVLVMQLLDLSGKPVRTYSLRPKTAAEIQADSDQAERLSAIAVYSALRNGTGTVGERLIRLERVAAALIRKVM